MAHFGWHSEAINHPNLEQLWRTSRVFMEKPCEHEFPPPKNNLDDWAMLSHVKSIISDSLDPGLPYGGRRLQQILLDPSSQGPGRIGRSGDPPELQHGNGRNPFWMERYFREVSGNLNDGFSISNCQEVKVGPQDPPWKRMRLDSDGRFDQQWDFDQNGYKWDIQQTEQGYFSDGSGIYTTLTDLYLHNPKCQ